VEHCYTVIASLLEDARRIFRKLTDIKSASMKAELLFAIEAAIRMPVVLAAQNPYLSIRFRNDLDDSRLTPKDPDFAPCCEVARPEDLIGKSLKWSQNHVFPGTETRMSSTTTRRFFFIRLPSG
jgi:hypothetical protein